MKIFRDLTAGREIEYEGQPTRLTWAKVASARWIAGYGPKVSAHGGPRCGRNHSAVCRSGFDFLVYGIREERALAQRDVIRQDRSHVGGAGVGLR